MFTLCSFFIEHLNSAKVPPRADRLQYCLLSMSSNLVVFIHLRKQTNISMKFEYATSSPPHLASDYLLPQHSKRLPSRLLHHLTLRLLNHLSNNLHPTFPPHSPLPLRHLAHTLQAHHSSQL